MCSVCVRCSAFPGPRRTVTGPDHSPTRNESLLIASRWTATLRKRAAAPQGKNRMEAASKQSCKCGYSSANLIFAIDQFPDLGGGHQLAAGSAKLRDHPGCRIVIQRSYGVAHQCDAAAAL